ncbi:HNH endonuclease family protein [Streptomyces sp. YPW6]|uniref:HNH endonuclease family protein n=1 Tax=Streptomyces sp. YPW6 TaxID=2840373 RepID=UPI00209B2942|nr:HNH endonuclease family protein [Streptomyces sp. YPW6]
MNRRATLTSVLTALLAVSLAACTTEPTATQDDKPAVPAASRTASPEASGAPGGPAGGTALAEAIGQLKIAAEVAGGYDRKAFKHWNTGLDADDGCDTREEVLLAEAVKPPTKGSGCKLSGGEWLSYYDELTITDPGKLDIDHMVPLEEAWSSGAQDWDADRREAYANDVQAERSLVAVSFKTNRGKGRKDPAEWLPPAESAHCTYASDWTGTKLRWNLTPDQAEVDTLLRLADGCPDTTVEFTPAS